MIKMPPRLSIVVAIIGVLLSSDSALAQAQVYAGLQNQCLNLSDDLFFGLSDSAVDYSILNLQRYLVSMGYLTATPNGYFGAGTLSAVKKFQTAHNISGTGRVGPITRKALQSLTCNTNSAANVASVINSTSVASSVAVLPPINSSNIAVTLPSAGSELTIGKSYSIAWNTVPNYIYSLILEAPNDSGAGFIVGDLSGGTSYSWQAGKIFSQVVNNYQNIATGTYRIRIEQKSKGASDSDLLSGWFTLVTPPLAIISTVPSSVPNDDRTPVVIYGSGFDNSSSVRFDGPYGLSGNSSYVSSDGTVIIITVPTFITAGLHSIRIVNSSGLTSNYLNLQVTKSALE